MDASGSVVWLSLDPVKRKVDFYPSGIAQRIEASRTVGDKSCVLGADFFNATVHLSGHGDFCQTTPGQHMGRSGFKAPGYRSVKRLMPDGAMRATLYGKRVHGEWRLVNHPTEAECTLIEEIPPGSIVSLPLAAARDLRPWMAGDLDDESDPQTRDRRVIVWQWCRGIAEAHDDLTRLGDGMWCPYLQDQNSAIEEAFARDATEISRSDMSGRSRRIVFSHGSTFALQRDDANRSERAVRRVGKTVRQLLKMLSAMQRPSVPRGSSENATPEFYCPITQDVMRDPVLTVDEHTYERAAILKWFTAHETSPLTGLRLPSLDLRPDERLRGQIDAFFEQQAQTK